jgi:hypothetical protein
MPHLSSNGANLARRNLSQPIETTSRVLDSTLESADFVEIVTLRSARRAGFSGIALEKISLAVREIVINAIIHGNGLDSQKKVFTTIARTRKQLMITISDHGDGFDLDFNMVIAGAPSASLPRTFPQWRRKAVVPSRATRRLGVLGKARAEQSYML